MRKILAANCLIVWILGHCTVALSASSLADVKQDQERLDEELSAVQSYAQGLNRRVKSLEQENALIKKTLEQTRQLNKSLQEQMAAWGQEIEKRVGDYKQQLEQEISQRSAEMTQSMRQQLEVVQKETQQAFSDFNKRFQSSSKSATLFSDAFPKQGQSYTVQKGDSLSKIARKFPKSSVRDIQNANRIEDPSRDVKVGQVLFIPEKD